MFAFVLALAAGMAIGNGSEAVSGEAYRGLDLRGEWEGELSVNGCDPWPAYADSATLTTTIWRVKREAWTLRGEGDGRSVRIEMWGRRFLGIYKQEGDRLAICFREAELGRPTSCLRAEGQFLLTLHRVKPAK